MKEYKVPESEQLPVYESEVILAGSIQESGSAGDIYSTEGTWTY